MSATRAQMVRSHLGYIVWVLRRRRPAPKSTANPADIASVRFALTMAGMFGEAMPDACRAALDDMRAAGISLSTRTGDEHASLVAGLATILGAADTANRIVRRLGVRT